MDRPSVLSLFHGHVRKGSHNPILRGLTNNMVVNHFLNGMILEVVVDDYDYDYDFGDDAWFRKKNRDPGFSLEKSQ